MISDILAILLIVFVVLKLAGVISWHWIWVLSPIWIGPLLGALIGFILHLILDKDE
ncbi:MAG: hypothetical protein SPK06_02840 [Kiritimatiellia bacterium]|nr:hypothetical protein [Kiritimatiellia bacterium]